MKQANQFVDQKRTDITQAVEGTAANVHHGTDLLAKGAGGLLNCKLPKRNGETAIVRKQLYKSPVFYIQSMFCPQSSREEGEEDLVDVREDAAMTTPICSSAPPAPVL